MLTTLMFAAATLSPDLASSPRQPRPTIAGIVASSGGTFDHDRGDFDILLNAVQTAGLVEALSDPEDSLTVLAPNDAAFIRLARNLGFTGNDEAGAWSFLVDALTTLGNGNPVPVLTDILLYHVAPRRYTFPQIIATSFNNQQIDNLLDAELRWSRGFLVDNDPELRNARIIFPGIRASNGLIHVIDRVLIPINL